MQTAPNHRAPCRRRVLAAAAAAVSACLWVGCATSSRPQAPSRELAEGPYVGAQVCAECHAEIFETQSHSPHALTAQPVRPEWAEGKFVSSERLRDPDTGQEYGIAARGDQYYQLLFKDGREVGAASIDLLIGSGEHGVSPLTFNGSDWHYLALTFYGKKGWDFSPMHGLGEANASLKDAHGWPVSASALQGCLRCHTTRLELNGAAIDMQRSELGVRCESCHGPGRDHVRAARARAAEPAITNPRNWSTQSFMALCQQCHNETSTAEGLMTGIPEDPASPSTVKYHVYGMEQSRCFQKSDGRLRCTTCHDPHRKSETAPMFYEARCRSCHMPEQAGHVTCPVNKQTGCLSCHMPKVRIERHTYFADHWIRAKSPFVKEAAQKAAAAKSHPQPR